jgi:DNA polymerase-3 subunit delta
MAEIKAHEAERALQRLDDTIRVVLLFGPDQGLVQERAARLVASAVPDPTDPFQAIRLDGGDLSADPMRLADEAHTIGMFSSQRAIRVTGTSRSLVAAVEPLLATPPRDALVVIEGGDWPRNHALRLLVQKSKVALGVPCYLDEGQAINALIDSALREAGLTIGREARQALAERLGADRQLSRREIEKLTLYVHGRGDITLDDVETIVGDAAVRDIDDVADGAFLGDRTRLDLAFARLMADGTDAGVILGGVLRQAFALAEARGFMDTGQSVDDAVRSVRALPYPRQAAARAALARWSSPQLVQAIALLANGIRDVRGNAALGSELAARTLWNLSQRARHGRA